MSNVLSHQTDLHLTLVQHYHSLVLPAHSLYLTLLSLVCLSLLDRYTSTYSTSLPVSPSLYFFLFVSPSLNFSLPTFLPLSVSPSNFSAVDILFPLSPTFIYSCSAVVNSSVLSFISFCSIYLLYPLFLCLISSLLYPSID